MATQNKALTKAEEELMQHLWALEKAYLKELVEAYPEPRPAYTTVATVVRVLVKKGFVKFHTYGKIHQYYPALEKGSYLSGHLKGIVGSFFGGSMTRFASHFASDDELGLTELEEIKSLIEEEISQRKEKNNE